MHYGIPIITKNMVLILQKKSIMSFSGKLLMDFKRTNTKLVLRTKQPKLNLIIQHSGFFS